MSSSLLINPMVSVSDMLQTLTLIKRGGSGKTGLIAANISKTIYNNTAFEKSFVRIR